MAEIDSQADVITAASHASTVLGRHRINIIWELTQAFVAVSVTLTTLYAAGNIVVRGAEDDAPFLLLSNAFFLVIGFYFGRTNHVRPTIKPGE